MPKTDVSLHPTRTPSIHYSRDADMLRIQLAAGSYAESEEVADGVVFDYDPDGKVIAIEFDRASRRVKLGAILIALDAAAPEEDAPTEILTVSELAQQLDIAPRTLQRTIQQMRQAGHHVGWNRGATSSTVLTTPDVDRIRHWRASHRPGRPRPQTA